MTSLKSAKPNLKTTEKPFGNPEPSHHDDDTMDHEDILPNLEPEEPWFLDEKVSNKNVVPNSLDGLKVQQILISSMPHLPRFINYFAKTSGHFSELDSCGRYSASMD